MPYITSARSEGIMAVSLRHPPANALNNVLLEELHAAMDEAVRDDEVRGLVIASEVPGVYCDGFDIREVFQFDQETATLFFARFIDLYESLYLLPKPVVSAVAGLASSWGSILAIASDLRVFAEGNYTFAFNDVNYGVALPPGLLRMIHGCISPGAARAMLLSGEHITPARAFAIGVANELVDMTCATPRAMSLCAEMARKPGEAFAALKRSLRILSGHSGEKGDRDALPGIIECWFAQAAQDHREAILASINSSPGV